MLPVDPKKARFARDVTEATEALLAGQHRKAATRYMQVLNSLEKETLTVSGQTALPWFALCTVLGSRLACCLSGQGTVTME